ncbi:hypothetical protein PL9631_1910001 [Planktothrix paucivesiculata PCC 9631]|uniref:Uncharacterized protein n=1 Tax=Planktothrix paucivesiculata PCC 9631 TaxID=671071 RepID=A0A7Z9BKU6_9CYAN|nr:hypothetical protein PL9631_1910001 [Planktothrix paucivesiculata PCC 9631]
MLSCYSHNKFCYPCYLLFCYSQNTFCYGNNVIDYLATFFLPELIEVTEAGIGGMIVCLS